MIYLLDLNYTLVQNSERKLSPFTKQIEQEVYRTDLIERLKGEQVILVTARPQCHTEQTLEHIRQTSGLKLIDWWFNVGLVPPAAKQKALLEYIYPKYGSAPSQYFGIESNPRTRAMYAKHGVESMNYYNFMGIPEPERK